jgi:hypothetical protein
MPGSSERILDSFTTCTEMIISGLDYGMQVQWLDRLSVLSATSTMLSLAIFQILINYEIII